MRIAHVAVLVSLAAFSQTHAQVCEGAASFSAGPVRLGAGLSVDSDAQSYGGQLAFGAPSGPFVNGTVSSVQYKDVSGSGLSVGGDAGFAIDLNPQRTVQFCPEVGFAYQTGPNFDTGFGSVSISTHGFSFGGAIGGVALQSPGFDFVPFVGGSYVIAQGTASGGGFSSSSNQNYGVATVGAGFVVSRVLTIQPSVSVPLGLNGGVVSFQLAVAFNAGGQAR